MIPGAGFDKRNVRSSSPQPPDAGRPLPYDGRSEDDVADSEVSDR